MTTIPTNAPKPHYQCFSCLRVLGFGYDRTAAQMRVTKRNVYRWFKQHSIQIDRPAAVIRRPSKPPPAPIDWEARYLKRGKRAFGRYLRTLIWKWLKRGRKSEAAEKLVGCSRDQFMAHIESQFKDGMAWNNYGRAWELDHIVPVNSFDIFDPVERRRCFHHTNLQPLSPHENAVKAFKMPA